MPNASTRVPVQGVLGLFDALAALDAAGVRVMYADDDGRIFCLPRARAVPESVIRSIDHHRSLLKSLLKPLPSHMRTARFLGAAATTTG